MELANPFTAAGQWYKGNLHTHTTRSDGGSTPEEMVARYREAGYDFVALTDHRVVTSIGPVPDGDFLVLLGAELDGDRSEVGESFHVCGFGLEAEAEVPLEPTVQEAINWIRGHGGEAVIAHPYWSGLVVADLLRWEGHLGLEVFNTTCQTYVAKGCSAVQWDDVLGRGRLTWGFAVDDAHGGRDMTTAWVMVKARALTREAILESLREGLFYSSWGPTIHEVSVTDAEVEVRTSPVTEINFVAQRWAGRSFVPTNGPTMAEARYRLRGHEQYLRVQCRDIEGRYAWSNPILLRGQPGRG